MCFRGLGSAAFLPMKIFFLLLSQPSSAVTELIYATLFGHSSLSDGSPEAGLGSPNDFGVGRGLVSFWVGRRPMAEVMADFLGVISAQALVVLSVYFLDSVQPETKHILAIN